MKTNTIFRTAVQLLVLGATAASANAAVIELTDYSLAPDGTNSTGFQTTNVGNVLPTGATPSVIYFITTFTFGVGSDAHLIAEFAALNTESTAGRLGVEVQDDGLVRIVGTGAPLPSVNLNQDMAGLSITLLGKLDYNQTHSDTFGRSNASDDTLMNLWINPTSSSVEGPFGTSAGDLSTVWNSAGFSFFRQRIQNQGTADTAGDSSITNTTILTGSDATFANALAIAIPEPSTALLGGLGLLALLRRRRNA